MKILILSFFLTFALVSTKGLLERPVINNIRSARFQHIRDIVLKNENSNPKKKIEHERNSRVERKEHPPTNQFTQNWKQRQFFWKNTKCLDPKMIQKFSDFGELLITKITEHWEACFQDNPEIYKKCITILSTELVPGLWTDFYHNNWRAFFLSWQCFINKNPINFKTIEKLVNNYDCNGPNFLYKIFNQYFKGGVEYELNNEKQDLK